MKYRYNFSCPCGNVLHRNYLAHGSAITCRKCRRTGEAFRFNYNYSVMWHPQTAGDNGAGEHISQQAKVDIGNDQLLAGTLQEIRTRKGIYYRRARERKKMKDINKIQNHIATLRLLFSAARGLERARQANSKLIPRTGLRGGRSTTNNARHDKAAEYYWKLENKAEEEAKELWN